MMPQQTTIRASEHQTVLDGLAVLSDRLGETLASFLDYEKRGDFQDSDEHFRGKLCGLILEVWQLRWSSGPCTGAVRVGDCPDCTTNYMHGGESVEAAASDEDAGAESEAPHG